MTHNFKPALCVTRDVLILKSVVTTRKTVNTSVLSSRTGLVSQIHIMVVSHHLVGHMVVIWWSCWSYHVGESHHVGDLKFVTESRSR